jgi:hypothetical protein
MEKNTITIIFILRATNPKISHTCMELFEKELKQSDTFKDLKIDNIFTTLK